MKNYKKAYDIPNISPDLRSEEVIEHTDLGYLPKKINNGLLKVLAGLTAAAAAAAIILTQDASAQEMKSVLANTPQNPQVLTDPYSSSPENTEIPAVTKSEQVQEMREEFTIIENSGIPYNQLLVDELRKTIVALEYFVSMYTEEQINTLYKKLYAEAETNYYNAYDKLMRVDLIF